MATQEKTSKKVKAHTRYTLDDGTILPGVTTLTGLLSKAALVPWANRLGLQGIEVGKYVDEKAEAGTLCHSMILAHLQNKETDTGEYAKHIIDLAENSFLSYLTWEKQHKLEPIIIEQPLVHKSLRFGGTPDFYGLVDGTKELLDFKTGKGIYDEYFYQISGYGMLLKAHGNIIENYRILNIPRTEDESFKEEQRKTLEKEEQIIQHLAAIYYLKKKGD